MIPCDCGELQAQFEDAVCRVFESEGSRFEVLDRNMISDPFEPDIVLMDDDEWVMRLVCYYCEDYEGDSLSIFPKTFGMRKWVVDSDETPTFFILGVGGIPSRPESLFFCRFFEINSDVMQIDVLRRFSVNLLRIDFLDDLITKDFERMYSPQ